MSEISHETNALVLAVLDAITIPHAATVAHDETRTRILLDRVLRLQISLETLLGSACPNVSDTVKDLEEKLTEHQPIGYVTHKQATQRIKDGATWTDAVSLDYRPKLPPRPNPPTLRQRLGRGSGRPTAEGDSE